MTLMRSAVPILSIGLSLVFTQSAVSRTAAAQAGVPPTMNAPTGLKFDKMVYLIGDSIQTVPSGFVWQVQSILSSEESLQETGVAAFLSGFRNESEALVIARMQFRASSLWVAGSSVSVVSFPFYLDEGTIVSAGSKKRKIVVIAQYRIE